MRDLVQPEAELFPVFEQLLPTFSDHCNALQSFPGRVYALDLWLLYPGPHHVFRIRFFKGGVKACSVAPRLSQADFFITSPSRYYIQVTDIEHIFIHLPGSSLTSGFLVQF